MKKFILFSFLIMLCCGPVYAGIRVLRLDNWGSGTHVVVSTDIPPKGSAEIHDVTFYNNGKPYECRSLKTVCQGTEMIIYAEFKKFTTFRNCYLTFVLNGKMQKADMTKGRIEGNITVNRKDLERQLKSLEKLKGLDRLKDLDQLKALEKLDFGRLESLGELSTLKSLDDPKEIQEMINDLYRRGIISKNTRLKIKGKTYKPGKNIVPQNFGNSYIMEAP